MINKFTLNDYSGPFRPELSLDQIKGIIIATFVEYENTVASFEYYTSVGAIQSENVVSVTFTVTNENDLEDTYSFHWLTTDSVVKLISYLQDALSWASEYQFPDHPTEKWEQKYNNKD